MQVKKFEATTLQEALDTVKRELGPEAIILQTKRNRRGFGLMSNGSVEVTAAVSDRSLQKKKVVESRVPEKTQNEIKNLKADKQADVYDRYIEKRLQSHASSTQDQVQIQAQARSKITATRYADIQDSKETITREIVTKEVVQPVSPAAPAVAPTSPASLSLHEEVRYLKQMVGELKSNQDESRQGSGVQSLYQVGAFASPALQDAFELLVVNGVDKRFAITLLKQVHFALGPEQIFNPEKVLDQLASEIMENSAVSNFLKDLKPRNWEMEDSASQLVAFIGPTGAGKTTTIAKIAGQALIQKGLKVALIHIHPYSSAPTDTLSTFAKVLSLPYRLVKNTEELEFALKDFQKFDLILMDTTSSSYKNTESIIELEKFLKAVPQVRMELVLAATTRDSELYDIGKRFSVFHPESVIFTKLDESLVYGVLYNVSQKLKLPLLYFTAGQKMPDDIETAFLEKLAALVMDL